MTMPASGAKKKTVDHESKQAEAEARRLGDRRLRTAPENQRLPLAVLACSSDEVVWTLLRAGFSIVQRAAAAVVLERGLRIVAVPTMTTMIAPEALLSMLRDAGLAYSRFVELVGEAPTDVDVLPPSRRLCL